MRQEERQVNYALQHTRRVNAWEEIKKKPEKKEKEQAEEKEDMKPAPYPLFCSLSTDYCPTRVRAASILDWNSLKGCAPAINSVCA